MEVRRSRFAWRSMEDGGIFVRFGEREERKVRENEMKREKGMW